MELVEHCSTGPTRLGSTDIPSMYEGKKALAGKYRTDQAHIEIEMTDPALSCHQ